MYIHQIILSEREKIKASLRMKKKKDVDSPKTRTGLLRHQTRDFQELRRVSSVYRSLCSKDC